MRNENEINYELINNLYISWLNEQDPFMQRKKKDNIKNRISPYEFLMYSSRYTSPFTSFKEIFSLTDLFDTLDEMEKNGIDITRFTNQTLVIKDIEDIQELNKYTKKETSSNIGNLNLDFNKVISFNMEI
jgi:dissimilatory sulfite reductase (desulfoviridin) alpha/beta subunit